MKTKLMYLLTVLLLLSGCSESKKIARFVKKNGARQVAAHIAVAYPEYLRADTIIYRDTIIQERLITVPEIVYDTILQTDTVNNCIEFHYADRNLKFDVRAQKVVYKIFERKITDTVTVYIDKKIPCNPCPTQIIVDEVVKQTEIEKAESKGKLNFYFKGFWSLFIIFAVFIAYKVLKLTGRI